MASRSLSSIVRSYVPVSAIQMTQTQCFAGFCRSPHGLPLLPTNHHWQAIYRSEFFRQAILRHTDASNITGGAVRADRRLGKSDFSNFQNGFFHRLGPLTFARTSAVQTTDPLMQYYCKSFIFCHWALQNQQSCECWQFTPLVQAVTGSETLVVLCPSPVLIIF